MEKIFKFDRDYTVNIVVIYMKLQDWISLGKIPSFVILRSVVLPWWNPNPIQLSPYTFLQAVVTIGVVGQAKAKQVYTLRDSSSSYSEISLDGRKVSSLYVVCVSYCFSSASRLHFELLYRVQHNRKALCIWLKVKSSTCAKFLQEETIKSVYRKP